MPQLSDKLIANIIDECNKSVASIIQSSDDTNYRYARVSEAISKATSAYILVIAHHIVTEEQEQYFWNAITAHRKEVKS